MKVKEDSEKAGLKLNIHTTQSTNHYTIKVSYRRPKTQHSEN